MTDFVKMHPEDAALMVRVWKLRQVGVERSLYRRLRHGESARRSFSYAGQSEPIVLVRRQLRRGRIEWLADPDVLAKFKATNASRMKCA